jgi:hypothetical protein
VDTVDRTSHVAEWNDELFDIERCMNRLKSLACWVEREHAEIEGMKTVWHVTCVMGRMRFAATGSSPREAWSQAVDHAEQLLRTDEQAEQ